MVDHLREGSERGLLSTLDGLEGNLAAIHRASPDLIFIHGADGQVIDANVNVSRAYGLGVAEFTAADPSRFMGASHTTAEAMEWIARARAGEECDFEWVARDVSGRALFLEMRLRPIGDGRVLAIGRDVSARKEAERLQRESEARWRILSEAALDGVVVIERGVIVDANTQILTMLGFELDETLGRSPLDFVIEAERDVVAAQIRLGRSGAYETTFVCKDGTPMPVEIYGRTIQLETGATRVTVIRDLTARKQADLERTQLEAELRQAQKMEAVGTLAGGIAHDFNNILTAIMGYADLILGTLPSESEAADFTQELIAASERAQDLVRQILVFTKHGGARPQHLHLSHMVSDSLKLLRPAFPSSVRLVSRLAESGDLIFADPTQISQIIVNLCTNAEHAMRATSGGTLTLGISPRVVRSRAGGDLEPGQYVELTVADTGSGIPAEVVDRIFGPFFTTKEGGGSGLGLAVVASIVREHGGAILVEAVEPHGSRFRVILPRATGEVDVLVPQPAAIPGGIERVMLVDDEPSIVAIASQMLTGLGYTVVGFEDPREALARYRESPDAFAAVISDLTMPGMSGLELLGKLRKMRPDQRVLVCTGYNSTAGEAEVLALGGTAFLRKPFSRVSLASALRRLLDGVDQAV